MHRLSSLSACGAALLALGLLAGDAPGQARGRAPGTNREGAELPTEGGTTQLQNEWKRKDVSGAFEQFLTGKEVPNEERKKDLKILETAAQWYTYRLTWRDYRAGTRGEKTIANVQQQFDNMLRLGGFDAETRNKDNAKFRARFARMLTARLKDVIEQGGLQPGIWAGYLLARLGRTGQPELLDELTALLPKPYPAQVKLYVIRALAEVLARYPALPDDPDDRKAGQTRLTKAGRELLKLLDPKELLALVEQKSELPEGLSKAERARIDEVIRYLRRDVVGALAQLRLPELGQGGKKLDGPVAYELARVVANAEGDLSPSASLSEQVNAAVGLGLMRPGPGSPYQPDVALYLVGRFIEKDLTSRYNEDFETKNTEVSKTGKNTAEKIPASEPWRVHAARLRYALSQLQKNAKDKKTQDNAAVILKLAEDVFRRVDRNDKVEEVQTGGLGKALDRIKPAKLSVYRGLDGYEIKQGGE